MRSSAEAKSPDQRHSSGFIRFATTGVVGLGAFLPLLTLWGIAVRAGTGLVDPGDVRYAALATACYLPLQVWLLWSATRDTRPRGQAAALAVMAVVIIGMLPVVGVQWVVALAYLAALVLMVVRPPWSLLVAAGFVVTSPLPAFRFGHPELAVNFTLTPLLVSASLAVPVWLVRAARQLAADRLALAEEAVVRERLRIDGELRRTVGAALETIAATASRADGLADDQLSAAEAELGVLVDRSRRTLAEARRLLSRYREASLQGELETAAALLAAAGIPIHVELPRGELAEGDDEAARVALRRDLARLLHDDAARRLGVTATGRDGWVRLALGTGAGGPAATTGVSA